MSGLGGKAKPTEDFFLFAANPRGGKLGQKSFGVREGSNDFRVQIDPERNREVLGISNAFGSRADQLGVLKGRIQPGFSALRQSQLDSIENARRRATGDLSDNLQRRRIAGSSFGFDALARTNAEFNKLEQDTIAQTELAEIEATRQLINEETQAQANSFQTILDELNTQLSTFLSFTTGIAPVFSQSAQLQQQANQFGIGSALNIGGTALGGYLTNKAISTLGGAALGGAAAGPAGLAASALFSAGPVSGIGKGLAQSIGSFSPF